MSFYASLTGYHKAALRESSNNTSDPPKSSCSISSSSSSSSFDKSQKLYHVYDLESNTASHSAWLQRRDSISSQRAVYPPALLTRNSYARCRSLGSMPVLNEDSTLPPGRNTTRSSSNLSVVTSALLAPSSYSQTSRVPSILTPTPSPLSTMHLVTHPTISIDALSKTLDPSSPSWDKPAIRHDPLSADPAIRKLSEGTSNDSNSDTDDDTRALIGPTGNPLPRRRSIRRKLFPASDPPNIRAPPPTIPNRAAGHSIQRVPLPVPRTSSILSNGSLQSEGSFNVRRPPAAARWSQQHGRRQWTYRNGSAYSVGGRSHSYGSGSMSSWYTDTIHE